MNHERLSAWRLEWVPTDVTFVIWLAEVRFTVHATHVPYWIHIVQYPVTLKHTACYNITLTVLVFWILSTQMTISFQVFFMEPVWDWLKIPLVANYLACSKASRTVGENSLKGQSIPSQATSKDNPGKKKAQKAYFLCGRSCFKIRSCVDGLGRMASTPISLAYVKRVNATSKINADSINLAAESDSPEQNTLNVQHRPCKNTYKLERGMISRASLHAAKLFLFSSWMDGYKMEGTKVSKCPRWNTTPVSIKSSPQLEVESVL